MQIIHHLTIDLVRQLPVTPIGAVQSDANTRTVEISLLENGEPWNVPEGITAAVAFRKPDRTKGLYDRLPDGAAAVTLSGSTVTAVLAPQVLTCAGEVWAAVVFHDAELNRLATFPFLIRVAADPSGGQSVSDHYYRYSTMEDISEAVDGALAQIAGATARAERSHVSMEKLRWNQLVTGPCTASTNGITTVMDGTLATVTGTATAAAYPGLVTVNALTGGHTVLLRLPLLPGVHQFNIFEYDENTYGGNPNYLKAHYATGGTTQRFALHPDTARIWVGLSIREGTAVNAGDHFNLFDLTEMFGQGSEPSAEEFARLYPEKGYAYCPPTDTPAPFLSVIRSAQTPATALAGRKFLIIGDSLSAANRWQKELTARGAAYTNHCLGGAGIVTLIDGGSNSNGSLAALTADEVTGKDAIIFFGGQNNHRSARGAVGDVYPENETVAGYLQYAINRIYSLLREAGNLTCRVMVVTPYCFGPSDYNTDAFQNDGAGLAQTIEDVANYNGIPVWNAYKNSGINPATLAVWGASDSDHVHLNADGYAHLGRLIAGFAQREVTL